MTHLLRRYAAFALMVSLMIPAAFVALVPRAHASGGSAISCIGGLLGLGAAGSAASAALSVPVSDLNNQTINSFTAGSSESSCIDQVILIPLAQAAIRSLLQEMTASVVDTIDGKNSAGTPQFVTNLAGNLRLVGDQVGLSFLTQFGANSNSPFASSIVSSLRQQYLQQTSLAGFFAANQCTLSNYSPNINSYLSGNWSQGGIGAWFALTTQSQNNPFTLYQAAGSQLGQLIASAQQNQRQTISQNSGFLSWCNTNDQSSFVIPATQTATEPVITTNADGTMNFSCPDGSPYANGGCAVKYACPAGYTPSSDGTSCTPTGTAAQSAKSAAAQTCYDSNGVSGTVETPGSIIHDYAQEFVVNSGMEQLLSANELDAALGTIISALFNQVLQGAQGLLGAGGGSASSASLSSQLRDYTGSATTATASAGESAQSVLTQLASYTMSWTTISNATQIASSSLQSLAASCPSQSASVQAVLSGKVAPVITSAQNALASAAQAQVLANRVQIETSSGAAGASGALSADIQALSAVAPTAADVTSAQSSAQVTGTASSTPPGSLSVRGGTIVDQMNLLSANANALRASCSTTTP